MSGFVLGENEGLNINFHDTKMIIKVSEKDSEGRYSLIVMSHQANSGPALHIIQTHPRHIMFLMENILYNLVKIYVMLTQVILCSFQKASHTNTSLVQTVEN